MNPFSNHEAEILNKDDDHKAKNHNEFNDLIKICDPNTIEKEDLFNRYREAPKDPKTAAFLEPEIKQLSDLDHEDYSGLEDEQYWEDKNEEGNSNNQLPEDFANMLDGNNNKDAEKIFYFSTLNSQDKLENVNEADSNRKQRYAFKS